MKLLVLIALTAFLAGCSNSFSRKDNPSSYGMAHLIELVKKAEPIYLEGLVFEEQIDLYRLGTSSKLSGRTSAADVGVPIYFKNCTFEKGIRSYTTTEDQAIISIFKGLSFEGCTFNGTVDMTGAIFKSPVYWQNNIFKDGIKLNGATFEHLFSFIANIVYGNWNSNQTIFRGKADFYESSFNDISFFQGAQFNGTANFAKCSFLDNTDFTLTRTRDDLFYTYAHFYGRTWFNGSEWSGKAEFHDTKFEGETHFDRVRTFREPDFRSTAFSVDPTFDNFTIALTNQFNYFSK
jgi:uncharacterized protein YjbI with pentapeptide repeats